MKSGFVYLWTHNESGKKYLGSHRGFVDDSYTGSGKHFLRAVKKYGLDTFTRTIVEFVDDDIYNREQYWLDKLNCAADPQFYNISNKARGSGDWTNEEKLQQSLRMKTRHATQKITNLDEYRKRQSHASLSPRGVNNPAHPNFGGFVRHPKALAKAVEMNKLRLATPSEQKRLRKLCEWMCNPTNPNSINNPSHPNFLKGRLKATDKNNPHSVNNPLHPAYGKGARIANANRRAAAPCYTFIHDLGRREENISCLDMAIKYHLTAHYLRQLGRGELQVYREWRMQ
jgi:hypothetical protein